MAGKSPAIILVRPQLPENVGCIARVLYNFGFDDLRLVKPKQDFKQDEKAIACSCNGRKVLESASLHQSVEAAVGDLRYAYAATARSRDLNKESISCKNLKIEYSDSGILFGPENSGLSNQDLAMCDKIVHIEAKNNPLNLVQAIAVVAYQCYDLSPVEHYAKIDLAQKKELSYLYNNLIEMLDRSGFFTAPEKRNKFETNLRSTFSRLKLTSQEVRTFLGIVKSLKKY